MSVYTCPKGHSSSTDDFCDECGAKIGGTGTGAVPVDTPDGAGRKHDRREKRRRCIGAAEFGGDHTLVEVA